MNSKANRTDEDKAFDESVGRRMRVARSAAGMNQTDLAKAIGVTFQQVQKYEKGVNRVSASRMALAARALGVTNGHLMGEGEIDASDPLGSSVREAGELARLIAHYKRLSPEGQKAVRALASSLTPA